MYDPEPPTLTGRMWHLLRTRGPNKFQVWVLALVIGTGAGFAALAFRLGISKLQGLIYRTDDTLYLHSYLTTLPWYMVLLVPIFGGIAVGIILHNFTPDGRVRAVADVIEGAALNNGRVERKAGIASALASLITLSTGGSSGREGPVVHMAALISSWFSERIHADGITGRDLLGCAVAAAVSASFNAPIAGTLFAMEVILRHFAVHALAPIVIAAAAGTVVNRLEFGNVTEFVLPVGNVLEFYVELPAFLLLGLLCGFVASIVMQSIFWADDVGNRVQARFRIPRYVRPAIAGAMLGAIAIWYPHIIGVGYETTSAALTGGLLLHEAIIFAVLKSVALAITMAGRMGGGVFSPSLMLGALTGLAFGLIATPIFPAVSGSETLYALAGMGAVAAAVLGAPISTTLIVFELTGDWQTGLAVMVAVSTSTALSSRLVDRSFFLTQLERRGVHLAAGPQAYLLSVLQCAGSMIRAGQPNCPNAESCAALIERGIWLKEDSTLEAALNIFENTGHEYAHIPVLTGDPGEGGHFVGVLTHVDALRAYNRALAETAAEEHS